MRLLPPACGDQPGAKVFRREECFKGRWQNERASSLQGTRLSLSKVDKDDSSLLAAEHHHLSPPETEAVRLHANLGGA